MRISIMQPGYLPWLGFFELIDQCDQFVILDDVQYTKRDWRSRNKIRTKNGWIWLTVPILSKGREEQLIKDVEINNDISWNNDHLNSIKINYSKAPFFDKYIEFFETLYNQRWEHLIDLNMDIIYFLTKEINISTPFVLSSSLSISNLSKNQRIIEICKKLNADELYD
ncbi:MAG: WbqC family protein, partial [Candidatus Omnitrophica bacterium]|nr:WbqC family protein [Candidatus Omnitrophota bacterium]